MIWLLFLEKFQTLRLSYDRKPEPCTPDFRVRCKMRRLKFMLLLSYSRRHTTAKIRTATYRSIIITA